MADPLDRLRHFLRELKRRKVYRVAITYLVVAAGSVQLVNAVIPASRLPAWSDEFFLGLAVFGFPIALVLAWAFEVTPEGVRRTSPDGGQGEGPGTGPTAGTAGGEDRFAVTALVGLAVLVAAVAGGWYLMGAGEREVTDRSIAVLPFESVGGEESAQLAHGVHDDLLTRLSSISDLRVISRTSVQRYRDTEKSIPQIARELDVKWIVEGSVQQAQRKIRVNAQLIDSEEDDHRWAKSYQRDLTAENLFAIQGELTRRVARSLQAELSPGERERIARTPTENLEAYRLYVQGRHLVYQRTEAEIRTALDYFHRAIQRDSSYALAWSGLADARALLWFYAYAPEDSVSGPALRAAERAVALEPDLAEGHSSLGIVRSLRQEGPSALQELSRAVDLKPSYSEAQIWSSWVRLLLGQAEQAVTPARRAVELDPVAPANRAYLALALLANGRYEDALREARRAAEIRPGYGLAHFMRGLAFHHLGRYQEAEVAFERARALVPPDGSPTHAEVQAATAASRAAAGDATGARRALARIDGEQAPFSAGLARAAMGEVDRALRAFERVRSWGSFTNEHLRYFFPAALGPVRDDSRYQDLLRRLNRAWGLNPDGSLPGETAAGTSNGKPTAGEGAAAASADGVVEVTARDFAFEAPAEIASGWTTIRFRNAGEQEHFLYLYRLPEGRSFQEYREEVLVPFDSVWSEYQVGEMDREGVEAALAAVLPEWFVTGIEPGGGPALTEPGETSQTTVRLDPGTYVMECYVKTPEGEWHTNLGMLERLVVTEDSTGAAPPEPDAELTLSNYEITTSGELPAGTRTVAVRVEEDPDGFTMHDVNLFRLDDDTDLQAVVEWMDWMDLEEFRAPAPGYSLGGVEHMSAGSTGYLTVELESGRYAWVSEGYAGRGMVREFTVE